MTIIKPGIVLISDPFLKDPNFMRTVVLVCEHQYEGSIGFVLNKPHQVTIGELVSNLENHTFPVYYGGPVQLNTVHFLHKRPDLIKDGVEIFEGVYWGGDFDEVTYLIEHKILIEDDIRFFIGYSGWSEGQLVEELNTKSWISTNAEEQFVFTKDPTTIWKDALKKLGGEYAQMINYPIDPQLN